MKRFILTIMLMVPLLAWANGGQVQEQRPLVDQITGEVLGIVVPVEACENYEVVPSQSGKTLYVICTDSD